MTQINISPETIEHLIDSDKKNIILDATILTSLMSCPLLSNFQFNLNLRPISGKSNSLECGSIVHTFLESYYGNIISGLSKKQAEGHAFASAELYIAGCKYCTNFTPFHNHPENTPDDLAGNTVSGLIIRCSDNCVVKPPCNHKINEYTGVRNTPKETEGYKTGWHYVLDTCQQYLEFYRNDHWVPLEVEVIKGKVLYEDDDIRILWKAKLDLVADTNQGIFPVDHKTMKKRKNNISMNNQFIGQCLIMNTRNVFINKIGFQTTLKPEEKFLRPPVSYSASRLLEWQSQILPFYAKLLVMYTETGYFPPNFDHCEAKYGNCNFLEICESDPSMREEEIKKRFIVGEPWNPTNENDED